MERLSENELMSIDDISKPSYEIYSGILSLSLDGVMKKARSICKLNDYLGA